MPRKKRTKAYVDTKVQFALAKRIVLHWVTFVAVAVGITFVLHFLTENPFQTWSEASSEMWSRHGMFFLVLLVMLPAFVWDTIKLSNRFAGPMLRFRAAVKSLASGEPCEPIEFRGDDFWCDLARDFNKVVDRIPDDWNAEKEEPLVGAGEVN